MKRIFIMLLIACSAIITVSAQQKKATVDNTPYNVKALFYSFLKSWGAPSDEVYSVIKNPNTNQIESSVKITYFIANVNTGSVRQDMSAISDAFKKDESKSYQLLHLAPTNKESFSLKVINENGQSTNYLIRAKEPEEMWLMCCKNPENPKLRDAYAIKWTYNDNRSKALGAIYQITSLRPDILEKNMSSASLLSDNQNTFTIDGRVGYDLNDSLYVVYMADTAEELDQIADDAFVATMPVVNKRFNFSVEIDKPKVGRIRTVMPDGSLCKLWTNLDFVPGETYRITTHNGWYEEDRDYENRVGRYSGHSLLNDLQRRGIDDQTVEVVDSVPEEFRVVNPSKHWRDNLSPVHKMKLELKVEQVGMAVENIKAQYKTIGETLTGFRSRDRIVLLFGQLLQHNKDLDKKYQELIQLAKKCDVPVTEMPGLYKEIVKFYTEQNKALNDLYKDSLTNGPAIRKLHEYVTKQTEKYIKEMEKSIQ